MKRSTFIKLTSSGIIAIAIPSIHGCRGPVEYPGSLFHPGPITKIRNPQQIDSIGKTYLEKTSNEANSRTLVRLLSADAPTDTTAIPNFIEQRTDRDFETGETVMVNGWILSVTEARRCALYSLEQTN